MSEDQLLHPLDTWERWFIAQCVRDEMQSPRLLPDKGEPDRSTRLFDLLRKVDPSSRKPPLRNILDDQ
jgi:hypothetical protein